MTKSSLALCFFACLCGVRVSGLSINTCAIHGDKSQNERDQAMRGKCERNHLVIVSIRGRISCKCSGQFRHVNLRVHGYGLALDEIGVKYESSLMMRPTPTPTLH